MSNTVNNNIPFVPENTIDPAAGLNESLNIIDMMLQLAVLSVNANTPPASPAEGDRYIIGTAPTGAWAGWPGFLARYLDGYWRFLPARLAFNLADGVLYGRRTTTWLSVAGSGGVAWGSITGTLAAQTDLANALSGKVNTVAGKQLSTEDFTSAEKTKLSGIATGATVNDTDANLKNRANHTGVQAISTVTDLQSALDGKIPLTQRGAASGVATLDAAGKIPTSQLPPLAVNEVFTVASQAAMLALTAERGDVAIRTDQAGRAYILSADAPGTLANWISLDQALSVALAALNALTPAADRLPYFDGASTAALAVFTAQARTLLAASTQAAQRIVLGLIPQTSSTDTTAGSLLTVGAFGLGNLDVPSTVTDVDSITIPAGLHRTANPGSGVMPAGVGTFGTLFVERYSAIYIKQRYTPNANGLQPNSEWVRTYNGATSAWTPWVSSASMQALQDSGGVNLLPSEYCVYGDTLPAFAGTSFTTSLVADAGALRGTALKFDWSSTSNLLATFFAKTADGPGANMPMARQKYIVSYYAKASVSGHVVAMYMRSYQADNITAVNSSGAVQQALTADWARYSAVIDLTSASLTGDRMQLAFQMNRSGVAGRTVWLDRVMVEPAPSDVTTPSPFVVGQAYDQAALKAPLASPAFTGNSTFAGALAAGGVGTFAAGTVELNTSGVAIVRTSGGPTITFSGPAGSHRQFIFQTLGGNRWRMSADSIAESGSDSGSNFALASFTDAGAFKAAPLQIIRSTGEMQVLSLASSGGISASGPMKPGQFTLTTLPSPATYPYSLIMVTNATGGPKLCTPNAGLTAWVIVNTTTTVS